MKSDRNAYEKAEQSYKDIRDALERARRGQGDALQELKGSAHPGIYEHFKSTEVAPKFYAVLRVMLEVDTLYPSVDYSALYPPHLAEAASRPLLDYERGFLKPVNRPEGPEAYVGPRFVLRERLTFLEAARLIDSAGKLAGVTNRKEFLARALKLARI